MIAAILSALPARARETTADPAAPLRLKPGLWEMQTSIEGGDVQTARALARVRAQMATLPPEQRRQLEQRMGGSGVELQLGGDVLGARICITHEMAGRGEVTLPAVGNDCTTVPAQRDGNSVRFATRCRAPRSTVEGSTTFLSDERFESSTTHTVEVGGNTRMTTIRQSGRWIDTDCAAPDGAGR